MRELKILTGIVYVCVAGVAVSLAGGIYTAVQLHHQAVQPEQHPNALPTPATLTPPGGHVTTAPPPGALPTPAQ